MGGIQGANFFLSNLILLSLTAWMVVGRFTKSLESNWPLVYYLLVVAHLKVFEGGLNPYWVYAAVVSGLFLRFEFMGGAVLKTFRVLELCALAYIGWRAFILIVGR